MADLTGRTPLVSVAMIAYNHERFITQAIESVLAQRTSFPIELVVGDDASTDGTARHIEALRARAPDVIRPIIRPTNVGAHRNEEGVLAECRGEFVAFLEGDDYWTADDKLQIQVDTLRTYNNVVGVFHQATKVDSLGRQTGTIFPKGLKTEVTIGDWLEGDLAPTASVMLRRNALGRLPDGIQQLKGRDWPMWVFASLHGPWRFLPQVMCAYRVHNSGAWSGLTRPEQFQALIEHLDYFSAHLPPPFSRAARRQSARLGLEALEAALRSDRTAEARDVLREIARRLPYYRMRDGKRLASALWETLSPRTHRRAKALLGSVRGDAGGNAAC
jgi:hypothetical protein